MRDSEREPGRELKLPRRVGGQALPERDVIDERVGQLVVAAIKGLNTSSRSCTDVRLPSAIRRAIMPSSVA